MIKNVPTNMITGFLGVGKTTAILNLLANKPANERWAVLVNEFGEVGIDGSLLANSNQPAVFIREVPGGCMCCAAGVPMQIALNQLLRKAKPDRLLIEPTGLGHPKEIIALLKSQHYQAVLQLNATLTLVDARNISDPRYTQNDTFNQQLAIADIIIANKSDLYAEQDAQKLLAFVANQPAFNGKPVYFVNQGQIEPQWLQQAADPKAPDHASTHSSEHDHAHHQPQQYLSTASTGINSQTLPACGYLCVSHHGQPFTSVSWRFSGHIVFQLDSLVALLATVHCERLKALFNTEQGFITVNKTTDALDYQFISGPLPRQQQPLQQQPQQKQQESKMDIIATSVDNQWTALILACRLP